LPVTEFYEVAVWVVDSTVIAYGIRFFCRFPK